jgi:hypothetical protein
MYRQLDVAGIVRLDQFSPKNPDIEVPGFFLVPHGEKVSCKEAFVCNGRIGQTQALPPDVEKIRMPPKTPAV